MSIHVAHRSLLLFSAAITITCLGTQITAQQTEKSEALARRAGARTDPKTRDLAIKVTKAKPQSKDRGFRYGALDYFEQHPPLVEEAISKGLDVWELDDFLRAALDLSEGGEKDRGNLYLVFDKDGQLHDVVTKQFFDAGSESFYQYFWHNRSKGALTWWYKGSLEYKEKKGDTTSFESWTRKKGTQGIEVINFSSDTSPTATYLHTNRITIVDGTWVEEASLTGGLQVDGKVLSLPDGPPKKCEGKAILLKRAE